MLRLVSIVVLACLIVQPARAEDSRAVQWRTPEEKAWVLGQMRLFLESIKDVADGLARHDFDEVAKSADARGCIQNKAYPDRPRSLLAKEPG